MLLTRKSTGGAAASSASQSRLSRSASQALRGVLGKTIDRRTFLKRSGVSVGAGAVATQLPFNMLGKAEAADTAAKVEIKRTVCTHCSVGCSLDAVVENGVWVRHEPVFDSPINLGSHCAKGASIREHGITADVEMIRMQDINSAYERMLKNDVKYRFVIDMAAFRAEQEQAAD